MRRICQNIETSIQLQNVSPCKITSVTKWTAKEILLLESWASAPIDTTHPQRPQSGTTSASKTLQELREVTREQAQRTLIRLITRSGPRVHNRYDGYPPAKKNRIGCWLGQKKSMSDKSQYIVLDVIRQNQPVRRRYYCKRRKRIITVDEFMRQQAHRLTVLAGKR